MRDIPHRGALKVHKKEKENNMKKIITLFLALCCFNSSVFAATRSEQSQELKGLMAEFMK